MSASSILKIARESGLTADETDALLGVIIARQQETNTDTANAISTFDDDDDNCQTTETTLLTATTTTTTTRQLDADIRRALEWIEILKTTPQRTQAIFSKLCGGKYMHVSEVHLLHPGMYVRWLRPENGTLVVGGRVLSVRASDRGTTVVVCKCGRSRVVQFDFNAVVAFRKLSNDESIVVAVNDHLEQSVKCL